MRKGKPVTVMVTVQRLEEAAAAEAAASKGDGAAPPAPDNADPPAKSDGDAPSTATAVNATLGATLRTVTAELRSKLDIADKVEGVAVTEIEASGAAAAHGVHVGDVIVEITNEKVSSPADVAARIEAVRAAGRKSALILLSDPKGEIRFVAVPVEAVKP